MSTPRRVSIVAFVLAALAVAQPVFAAGGWYLLVPPRSDQNPLKVLDGEPLSKWTQQGAYDSASECEAVKNALLNVERSSYYDSQRRLGSAQSERKDPAAIVVIQSAFENYRANYDGLSASRCIKTDDLRLGK